ncbi:hypothetical protein AVDCRST_MAG81-570 [uncultured Synechococcales cyanobacterium]|uniref:Uncharacterized protein n=1 Tax=uncultured Synechococcales cyanobacterium TaxID=1936017 RepID=A0A6J4UVA9_9CYAN|nr:hypothetical protein AVDCRST_MAG81-570 [uncultured Synechococcales cyanobacterium]
MELLITPLNHNLQERVSKAPSIVSWATAVVKRQAVKVSSYCFQIN